MVNHPHIKTLFELYQNESQAFRKVHRMIDLFESIIKSHTVVILSEYVKYNQLSEAARGLLSQGLRTPALGTWQLFSRILFKELCQIEYSFIDHFSIEFALLDNALNIDKTNVINLRNDYAHGATPSDIQCESDIKKFEPFLKQMLDLKWLQHSSLKVKNGKVFLQYSSGELCLHPVLVHRNENSEASFAFFNDLKNNHVGLLNYPLGKRYREREFFDEFHKYLPLKEWKKTGTNEFYQRIEELTETFKGRNTEREKLLRFVQDKNKGYFSIQGNPGMGKSALIAQFFKDLRAQETMKNVQVVEYFIRRGTQQSQVDYLLNYLIKRTDEYFAEGREIRAEGNEKYELQNQLFGKWRLWGEQSKGKKLLFLIDGLDEGLENNMLTYMPRENFENVLIVYGSRPGGHKSIDEFWATLPVEHHTKLELSGLSKEDIRALIYEVANKYEIQKDSQWIDEVQKRSTGNPLYLKLLCDAIENGSIALNVSDALPKEINEYYKAILQRYANDTDGDALLGALYTFVAAKDYLTIPHLGLINNLGDAILQRIGNILKEVLYENPLTTDVLDYQLFHESFREYLIKENPRKAEEASERIMDFCAKWKELEGSWEQRYTLEHYATHLSDSKKETRAQALLQLLVNSSYTDMQKRMLKQFNATRKMLQLSLVKAGKLSKHEAQLEAALQLVNLKYDEANDAHQVQALVTAGDIDLALKRIGSFGGTDKEGVRRRFILYMLCLMELSFGKSINPLNKKTAIAKILQHLDEQLPLDHSILDWNEFYPSYLMFQMACDWADWGLDYLPVYRRTKDLDLEWLINKGPFSNLQVEVLVACAKGIGSNSQKNNALKNISVELAKQGLVEKALACANGISDDWEKSSALKYISAEMAKQGLVEEALTCATGISIDREKSGALGKISSELAKQRLVDQAESAMQEALTCATGIIVDWEKSKALGNISSELAKQGLVDQAASAMQESLACANEISDDWERSIALEEISSELAKQGLIEEALSCANRISEDWAKSRGLTAISLELAKQGLVEDAIACADDISIDFIKCSALEGISLELVKQGLVDEALACANGIRGDWRKSEALRHTSSELAKKGFLEKALACANGISVDWVKSSALKDISSELAKQGLADKAASTLQEALACAKGISMDWAKSCALKEISSELAKQGLVDQAASALKEDLVCAKGLNDDWAKSRALRSISSELAKQGLVEDAFACTNGIGDSWGKSRVLKDISSELAKQGLVDQAASAMQEALAFAEEISEVWEKSCALGEISSELAKQGHVEKSLACVNGISDNWGKSGALKAISSELAKQGHIEKALACANGISDNWGKSSALKAISSELAKQCQIEKALACAKGISIAWEKSSALKEISSELSKQGLVDQAAFVMQEALTCANGISIDWEKCCALKEISSELVKQGLVDQAASAMQEALSCTKEISEDSLKNNAQKEISSELARQGLVEVAEAFVIEIPEIATRHECWKGIAEKSIAKDQWKIALQGVQAFKSDEARLFYLKGWCEHVPINNVTDECIAAALPFIANDSESIETLLQKYALQKTLLGNPQPDLLKKLNRTLNIQWAIDIADQFPKKANSMRLYTNLDVWLHEIKDEDDRDDIKSWAEKVKNGKMSIDKFNEKVKGKN